MTPINARKIIKRNMEVVEGPVYKEDILGQDFYNGFYMLKHKCGEIYYCHIKDLLGDTNDRLDGFEATALC